VAATYAGEPIPGTKIQWVVFLAPLPGLFALLRTSIGFNVRTAWFSEKATRLNIIRRRYINEVIDIHQAVSDLTELDGDMEGRWRDLLSREAQAGEVPAEMTRKPKNAGEVPVRKTQEPENQGGKPP